MLVAQKWYITNAGHGVVAGPFDAEDDAHAKFSEYPDARGVHQAKDAKTFVDGYPLGPKTPK